MTDTIDASEIIDEADEEVGEWRDHMRDAAELFHDREGSLFTRENAVSLVQDELSIDERVAQKVVANLVSDTIDPVVQIPKDGERYIGIIEYNEYDGAYGYVDFDDRYGKRKRVICAQCVQEADHEYEVSHATAGDPNGSFGDDASYGELLNGVHQHYEDSHNVVPENVKTGASLASPTTIGGNTSWHAGNDGDTSGLDADTVDGYDASSLITPSSTQAANPSSGYSTIHSDNYRIKVDNDATYVDENSFSQSHFINKIKYKLEDTNSYTQDFTMDNLWIESPEHGLIKIDDGQIISDGESFTFTANVPIGHYERYEMEVTGPDTDAAEIDATFTPHLVTGTDHSHDI